jgi:rSAM/selenodomain-associated transferase 1
MKYPDARLLIFSKAPQPGLVKTRLIPLLGSAGACTLYCSLLEATLAHMTERRLCPVELYCDPDTDHKYFQHCQQHYPVNLRQQSEGDLGERMSQALRDCLQRSRRAILIGADCPTLTAGDIEMALEQLSGGCDIVLGPARDGGYYLVGMSTHHCGVFTDIPWGTGEVLERTLRLADKLGLQYHLLEARSDIDTPDDYHAWRASGHYR